MDDQLALHPKIIAAGNAAMGLWLRAGSWCAAQLTDGRLPAAMVGPLGGRTRDVETLIRVHLWERVNGGYQFIDWSDYQPTKSQVRAEREATRKRVAEFREKRRNAVSNAVTDTVTNTVSNAVSNSVPTRPDPTHIDPRGSGGIELELVGDREPNDPGPTERLIAEWLKWLGADKRPPTKVVTAVGQQIADLLADGIPYRDVKRGLIQWQTRGNLGPAVLPGIVHEVRTKPAVNGDRRQQATDHTFDQAMAWAAEQEQKAIGS